MCSLLTDLLAALYVDPENLSAGIAEAQGIVLDELQAAAEAGFSWTGPVPAAELGAAC
jgi:hypothetical protein